jgi:CelD/BcsL family acetyltransferase involved in cellulose biosynthesis
MAGIPEPRGRHVAGATVRVARGRHAVLEALAAATDLFDQTGVPFCARPLWLSTWYSRTKTGPLAVSVERDGKTVALACLAIGRTGPLRTVALAGDGPSDYGRLPACDNDAAVALAGGVVEVLTGLRQPWRLRLAQLPVDDPVARELLYALPGARLAPAQGSPAMGFGPDRAPERHLSAKGRRAARRGRARLAEAGVSVRVDRVHRPDEIRGLLTEVVALHRARDRALGRRSDLDRVPRRIFFVAALCALADNGQVDIWTLRCDGALGAYVVGVRDGASYRTLDARIADTWQSASPGQILRTDMITALLADPALTELDWMRGELRHKMQDATQVVAAQHLIAESSPALTSALRHWQRVRQEVRTRVPQSTRQWIRSRAAVLNSAASRFRAMRATPASAPVASRPPGAAAGSPERS